MKSAPAYFAKIARLFRWLRFFLPRHWPIKIKVGVYCTALTLLALIATAGVLLPLIYHKQLDEVETQLSDNANVIFERVTSNRARDIDPSKPINPSLIPLPLKIRYIQLAGPKGEDLYRSENLRETDLRPLPEGRQTIRIPSVSPRHITPKDETWISRLIFGDPAAPPACRVVTVRKGLFTIHIGTRLALIEGMQKDLLVVFSYTLPLVALVVFASSFLLANWALRPVSAMTSAAERISAESPHERLPRAEAHDEIARLTTVLNQSFDRLQRAYNAAARFSADASHQLKTPIAVLRAGIDELKLSPNLLPDDREILDALLQQTRRLTMLVEDLLMLAQADAGRLRVDPLPLDLMPLLQAQIDDIEALGMDRELTAELKAPTELYAIADIRRIRIILQNLGENSVKYNRPSGRIVLHARREGDWVRISVGNNGHAIPEQHQTQLFERFNRAGIGENIKGHGLGLNIARELARAHGGDLELTSSNPDWTEFTLTLRACPAPAGDSATAGATSSESLIPAGSPGSVSQA
jgi:signal transduction histidine kinase